MNEEHAIGRGLAEWARLKYHGYEMVECDPGSLPCVPGDVCYNFILHAPGAKLETDRRGQVWVIDQSGGCCLVFIYLGIVYTLRPGVKGGWSELKGHCNPIYLESPGLMDELTSEIDLALISDYKPLLPFGYDED